MELIIDCKLGLALDGKFYIFSYLTYIFIV